MQNRAIRSTMGAALLGSAILAASAAAQEAQGAPGEMGVRMTWFGVTNWYYEIGDIGALVDGVVSKFDTDGATSDEAQVERVYEAIDNGNGIDKIFIGHEHDDHSFDAVAWAKATGAAIYTSKVACDAAIANGLPADQCTPLYGGERIALSDEAAVHAVRWAHSTRCGATSEGGTAGIETFGFLFVVDREDGKLAWFISDSGAGGPELVTNRVVEGVDYGAPFANLADAVREAGLSGFDLWQGGPESRVVNQARILIPAFDIETFVPHHFGARGGFDLTQGLHYAYDIAEMPKLKALLSEHETTVVAPVNYFDAFVYDRDGYRPVENAEVKLALGFPAEGPGPIEQGPNPRAGELECVDD